MIVTMTTEIKPRRIADMMVTAIEGGIGHWCESVKLVGQPWAGLKQPWYDDESLYQERTPDHAQLKIAVVENEDGPRHVIGLAQMERGFLLMQRLQGQHWQDFINENEDANTADVWFQLTVFGEVVC